MRKIRNSGRTIGLAVICLLALGLLPAVAVAQGTLFVEGNKVGVKVDPPAYDLDVNGVFQVKNYAGGTANQRFDNGNGQTWNFQNNGVNGAFAIRDVTATRTPFKIEAGAPGNLFTLKSNGTVQVLGVTVHPDYVFEPVYALESIEEHATYMWQNKHLPAVGPGLYNEDGKPFFELGSNLTGMLEELEKAHIYIDQLNDTVTHKAQRIADLEAQNALILERLAHIEARFPAPEAID